MQPQTQMKRFWGWNFRLSEDLSHAPEITPFTYALHQLRALPILRAIVRAPCPAACYNICIIIVIITVIIIFIPMPFKFG